jgi:hypothetical protein
MSQEHGSDTMREEYDRRDVDPRLATLRSPHEPS